MKKQFYLFFVLCGIGLLAGCGGGKKSATQGADLSQSVAVDEPQVNRYDSILWSGWSVEERQKHVKIWRVVIDHVKSKDGSLHLDLSREEARKINLPDTLYELFVANIRETNRWMDSTNMPAVERAEMCDDYAETAVQAFEIYKVFCKSNGLPTGCE